MTPEEFQNKIIESIKAVATIFGVTTPTVPPPVPPPVPPTVPPPPPPTGDTIGPGVVEYDTLHIPAGNTVTILPGTELVRQDLPVMNHIGHPGGGIIVEGTLVAIRNPGESPIVFRSANPNGIRGHIMITGSGVGKFVGCEIRDMGRTLVDRFSETNLIAIYPLHFHLCTNGDQSYVENCTIHNTVPRYRHGIVIHGINNLVVRNNYIHHVSGSGIYLEDGTEDNCIVEWNTIEDVVGTNPDISGSPERPDTRELWSGDAGYTGNGIYCRGPLSVIRNNTVRRCPRGYQYFQFFSPTRHQPIREFSNNIAEDCYEGLTLWSIGGNPGETIPAGRSTFYGFIAKRCFLGVFSYEQADVTYDNFILDNCITGIGQSDYAQRGFIISNSTFLNCGFNPSTIDAGGGITVEGCRFDGVKSGIGMATLFFNGSAEYIPDRKVTVRNTAFENGPKIEVNETFSGNRNLIKRDELFLVNCTYNGSPYTVKVYRNTQAANEILPISQLEGETFYRVVGSPEVGLTNQEALDRHGVCRSGEILPTDAISLPWIIGGKVK